MPPTRGHDLKQSVGRCSHIPAADAPHTGARLKTSWTGWAGWTDLDAPHTGARLETLSAHLLSSFLNDAPHTGARLETPIAMVQFTRMEDAPHTGARLETDLDAAIKQIQEGMPPTRGHDLKRSWLLKYFAHLGCPPHGGTT